MYMMAEWQGIALLMQVTALSKSNALHAQFRPMQPMIHIQDWNNDWLSNENYEVLLVGLQGHISYSTWHKQDTADTQQWMH